MKGGGEANQRRGPVIRSRGGDESEVVRRLWRAARLTFGAMLVVVALGYAGPSQTASSNTTPQGNPSSGTRVASATGAPTNKPAPTPDPTPIPMPTFNGHTTVYWVFAHPDDETISSAGALYESQETGNRNVIIFVTDGETTGVGPMLALSLRQVAAARDKEATAALAVIGIVPVFLHEPETGGGVEVGFVEQEIAKLASETKGTVVFEGLSPNDGYVGLPHGNPDHHTVAMALQSEFDKGVIKNLVFRNLANYSNGKRYGTCEFLSAAAMAAKQEMRAAYAYVNPSIGRYGIAGKSVHSMWKKTATEPECHEHGELLPGVT